ncbi:MAG: adenylate/guanylate cyclase protein, partial [Frankiales bacterium]|nr:adenylate/guanylate cyclase protein [Frankiales bacterium]
RRPGIFEGLPRVPYRFAPGRYFGLVTAGILLHGLAVTAFGLLMLSLYLDLHGSELAVYAAALAGGYLLEGLLAAVHIGRALAPTRAWLRGPKPAAAAQQAWISAARVPAAILTRVDLLVVGAVVALLTDLLLAHLLDLPAKDSLLLLPLAYVLYLSSGVLRYIGLELGMRPVLEEIGLVLTTPSLADAGSSLHRRLVAGVPTVTWGSGVIVAGLMTDDSRSLGTVGQASLVALGVAAAVSVWLSLVLADAVSGPIVDLRNATNRVAAGDLGVRVPVVSTDEAGQLAEAFNAMVVGLDERERLRDAIGVFVDPSVTERVLEEGTDLQGEELEVSVLFLDVRDFTAFAESAPAHAVVTALNELYDLVVPVVTSHGGHANRFLGDGLLAVFGAPDRHADHAVRAVQAACAITDLLRQTEGLRVGIGINSGPVVVGTIGGGGRRDFTVIGDTVNTAARAEGATRTTGDELLITEATYRALDEHLRAGFAERPHVPLKGKTAAIRLYARE